MTRRLRVAIAIGLAGLLVAGVFLVYFQTTKSTVIQATVEKSLCGVSLTDKIPASQTEIQTCQVSANSWFDLFVTAPANFSLRIVASENASSGNSTDQLLYSSLGRNISASFPAFSNSLARILIQNPGAKALSVSGYVNVSMDNRSAVPLTYTTHQYRLLGLAFIALAIIFLFIDIWNPWNILTRRNQ